MICFILICSEHVLEMCCRLSEAILTNIEKHIFLEVVSNIMFLHNFELTVSQVIIIMKCVVVSSVGIKRIE